MGSHTEKIAYFIACGAALQVAESMIPHPVPGVRLGLANMMTLLALNSMGAGMAFRVAFLRPIVSSLILGSLLGPSFFMSLSGSVAAFLTMWFTRALFRTYISNYGVSILGAVSHNLAQLIIAYFFLIRHPGVFVFLPVLLLSALFSGYFTGWCVSYVVNKNRPEQDLWQGGVNAPGIAETTVIAGTTEMTGINIEKGSGRTLLKIFLALPTIVIVSLVSGLRPFIYSSLWLVFLIAAFKVPVKRLRGSMAFLWVLVFASLVSHVLMTPGTEIFRMGFLRITTQGLENGGIASFRIVLITISAGVLLWSTGTDELLSGLLKFFSPLRRGGVPVEKIFYVIGLAIVLFPSVLQKVRGTKPISIHSILDSIHRDCHAPFGRSQ